nr:putative ribonuclease h protein [Quercus suber]
MQKPVRKECRGQAKHANSAAERVAVNSEEEITEEINVQENSRPETEEVLTQNNCDIYGENNSGNYGVIYGHKGDPLEDQILEIDRELNSVEIIESIEREEAALNKEKHVDSPNTDSTIKIPEILEKGLEADAGHVAALNPLTDEPRKKKPDTQARVSSREGEVGQSKTKTWTRVARFAQKGDAQAKAEATGKGSARIVSPQVAALKGAQVAALINPNTRSWNIDLLNQHFLSFEVTRIKAIPLSWTEQEDRLIWPDNHDGEYLVKSGYQMLCKEANSSAASSSDSSHRSAFWKRLWKLHVPNKIKFFLWRVCSNTLPTKDNLKKRKILDAARCSACLQDQETAFHALWSCESLKEIWNPCFRWVRTEEDRLIWPDSHDGEYLVKSGYQMLCKEANSSAASSSDSSHRSAFWKCLWKLHVPNKIKFFLWRVCSNALPTKDNLKKRKILDDARCSACL